MTIVKLVREKWLNFIPLIVVGLLCLVSYVSIHGYQFHICPGGDGAQYYSCGDLDDYYGTPLSELFVILIPTALLAIFIPKIMFKRWMAVFLVLLLVTLWYMSTIKNPRGAWENHRSAAADLSGAVFFIATLVWLGVHYLMERRKNQK